MFTGIIEEAGTVRAIESKNNLVVLKIRANRVLSGTRIGDSVAINGVCLTVTQIQKDILSFDMMKETIAKTSLNRLHVGHKVNLERALTLQTRLGGHWVTGHVDAVGLVQDKILKENYLELQISLAKDIAPYLVPKGSICIDGVSLTVGEVKEDYFSVYLIPLTKAATTLGNVNKGDKVNIETDILAKYVLTQMKSFRRK